MRGGRTTRWLGALVAWMTLAVTTGWTVAPYLHNHPGPARMSLEAGAPAAPTCGEPCTDHAHHAAAHALGLLVRLEAPLAWPVVRHESTALHHALPDPWLPPPGKPPRQG